jgi:hypothetical protein
VKPAWFSLSFDITGLMYWDLTVGGMCGYGLSYPFHLTGNSLHYKENKDFCVHGYFK